MKLPGILSICLICLHVTACDNQKTGPAVELTAETTTEIKTAPVIATHEATEQTETATEKKRQAVKLSIHDLAIDDPIDNEKSLYTGDEPTGTGSSLFGTPHKNSNEPVINLSGKLFTDDDKLENRDYLNSIEGIQINIKGSFN